MRGWSDSGRRYCTGCLGSRVEYLRSHPDASYLSGHRRPLASHREPDLDLGHVGAAVKVLDVENPSGLPGNGCGALRVALVIMLPSTSAGGLIEVIEWPELMAGSVPQGRNRSIKKRHSRQDVQEVN